MGQRRAVGGLVIPVEIRAHLAQRPTVRVAPYRRHGVTMADADAQQHPAARQFVDGGGAGMHGHRVASVGDRDANAQADTLGACCEVGEQRERVAAGGLLRPERVVTEGLGALRKRDDVGGRQPVEIGPDANRTDGQRYLLRRTVRGPSRRRRARSGRHAA